MVAAEVRTPRQAREILGVREEADPDAVRRAFRAAVRKAHPDHGGDAETLRRVIDANRLLTELQRSGLHFLPSTVSRREAAARPAPRAAHAWPLEIEPSLAVTGGSGRVVLPDGRAGRVTLPPGLRAGDTVRLNTSSGVAVFRIVYARGDLEVRGDDLWMTAFVSAATLEAGGEIEIDTPHGRKRMVVAAGAETVRLKGLGLPAKDRRRQGDLFVQMQRIAAPPARNARDLLRRFAASWAA